MRHRGNLIVMIERGVETRGRFKQMAHDPGLFLARQAALAHGKMRGKRGKHRKLASERLGAGDADFRAGVRRQQQIGLTRHRTGRHVDDDGDGLPLGLAVAQGGKRISGLAALRNEQRQPAGLQHRLAVTELAGVIDVHRHAREVLEPVLRDHARVVRGATSDDGDPLDAADVEIHLRERHFLFQRA